MTTAIEVDPISRDRWGRPLITPPDGGKPIAYTRVSTLAKTLDDTEGLTKWKQRQTVAGIVTRPDLIALAASARDDKSTLDRVAREAMDAASSSAAANTGTALHSMTEAVDAGQTLEHVPAELRPHLDAYARATELLEVVDSETFVVIDALQTAGSFDRLYRLPDGRLVVGDIKTGADAPRYAQSIAMQVARYAHGQRYDHATGTRSPLAEQPVDLTTGLLVHLPANTGQCHLYVLNLTAGWAAATVAVTVRAWRKNKNICAPYTPAP